MLYMRKGFPLSLLYEKITEQARLLQNINYYASQQTTNNNKILDLRKHYSLHVTSTTCYIYIYEYNMLYMYKGNALTVSAIRAPL